MITDGILAFFHTILQAAFAALPPWTPTVDTAGVKSAHEWLMAYNHVFPVTEIAALVGAFSTIFGIMYGFKFVMMIVNVIRGSG